MWTLSPTPMWTLSPTPMWILSLTPDVDPESYTDVNRYTMNKQEMTYSSTKGGYDVLQRQGSLQRRQRQGSLLSTVSSHEEKGSDSEDEVFIDLYGHL